MAHDTLHSMFKVDLRSVWCAEKKLMNEACEIILLLNEQEKDRSTLVAKKKVTNEEYVNELFQTTLKNLAQQSGKSLKTVKKMHDEIEKSLEKSIDPKTEPRKFFAILTNVLKHKLGLPGVNGGRTVS